MGKSTKLKQPRAKKPQSRAKKGSQPRAKKVAQPRAKRVPQSRAKEVPQSRTKAGGGVRGRGAVGTPGWTACLRFIAAEPKLFETDQLLHINSCTRLMVGVQAEVNWYAGGNAYVDMTREVSPGVYLGTTSWYPVMWASPDECVAQIRHLRWLGPTREFLEATHASRGGLGNIRYRRLVAMLPFNVDTESSGGSESAEGSDESSSSSN